MVKVKKMIGLMFIIVLILISGIYLAKNYILKEILERKLSEINNAPVYIKEVQLSPLDNYIIVKNIDIMSTLNNDNKFISIDELKSYYKVNYLTKIVEFNDTEIENIVFFENGLEKRNIDTSKINIFSDKITKNGEEYKKNQVLSELKNLYIEKIGIDTSKIDKAIKQKLIGIKNDSKEIKNSYELNKIKDSFRKIKSMKLNKNNISEVLTELSKIEKSSHKIIESNDFDRIRKKIEELRESSDFKNLLDDVINEFLSKNKFVLKDLDTYINIYLNVIYEKKIYSIYTKYLRMISEIDKRKYLENLNNSNNSWELYFNNIILTSNMYGINFNGEIKNLSSKISKNLGNMEFKLFGEKGQTIGELRGYLNIGKYQTEAHLNIPEVNLMDFSSQFFEGGEGAIDQYLYTDNYYMNTEGRVDFKNIRLNGKEIIKMMNVDDELIKDLLIPIFSEIRNGVIDYKYDTRSRSFIIKTNFSNIFEKIINSKDSSLQTKMREKIKEEYMKNR